ncbi:SMI1/KNR4 family protein [Streptomyces sp. LE64]|uniref:SMI1/KNR4 family protein n=1 Tax=Streptomyces sp. LE64 TaxID=3448653 RepID=UPI0040430B80
MVTVEEIGALLGEPRFHWSDPGPWTALEQELGVRFPTDFREVTDAYGPVVINGHLQLDHPGHRFRNLGERIREEIGFWQEEDLAELLPHRAGPHPGELLPVATGSQAEYVFLRVPREPSQPWAVGVQEMDTWEFVLHEMTFGDWLLAYLKGEDVMVGATVPARPSYASLA